MAKKKKQAFRELIEPEYADLMAEAKDRFAAAVESEQEQREDEIDDLEFCKPEGQWPEGIKADRDGEGRPCLVVDRTNPFVHQVVNEQRRNRPQPQVNPTGDGATQETAEIFQGMIRHIAYQSSGDTAIDTAFESMVRCGRGYFRVLTQYRNDTDFDQDILIKRIPNLHSVYLDPAYTEPDGSDAEWGFITYYLPRNVYRSEFPDSKMADYDDAMWSSIGDEVPEWAERDGSACLVVEYFKKERHSIEIEKNGKKRDGVKTVVRWYKMNAVEVLETTVWPGKYIPIIPVLGTELYLDGKLKWSGLVRSAKDPQRAYNYWKSAQAETIALAPRAPYVGPKGFMGNQRGVWDSANKKALAVLEYEAFDSQNRPLPPPTRTMAEPPIQAITQAMMGAVDDMKATTGMYDPSLGNRESTQSGVAIRQLQNQGQSGNFHYQDNLSRSMRHLGRLLIDLIPKIYDSERVVRIVKPDESTALVTVNGPTGQTDPKTGVEMIYQLDVGTYDVTVNVGPSYQTRRQENLAFLESLMQGPFAQLMTTAAPDLVIGMTDFAISPILKERLAKAVPPQFQDQPAGQPQIPPQLQQQMQALTQQHAQLVQQLNAAHDALESKQAEIQAKNQVELQKAQIDSQTKVEVARIGGEAEVLAAEAKAQAQGSAQQIQTFLKEMEAQLGDVQDLALAHHKMLSTPPAAPAPTDPNEQQEPPESDPMQQILVQHGQALDAIGKALHRLGGPKKIVLDGAGKPVGVAPVDGGE